MHVHVHVQTALTSATPQLEAARDILARRAAPAVRLRRMGASCSRRLHSVPEALYRDRQRQRRWQSAGGDDIDHSALNGALAALESTVRAMADGPTKAQLHSACAVAHKILQDHQPITPVADSLAVLTSLPEALSACRPPTLARQYARAGHARDDWPPVPSTMTELNAVLVAEWGARATRVRAREPAARSRGQTPSARPCTGYDLWEVDDAKLPTLAYQVLCMHAEVASSPAIDKLKLWRYVCEVSKRYHSRPFHNLRHGVDALLAASTLLRMVRAARPEPFDNPLAIAALLISAFVHDVDHPGCMSSFLVATSVRCSSTRGPPSVPPHSQPLSSRARSTLSLSLSLPPSLSSQHPLAVLYNGRSVLENHHAATAVALLSWPELDFLHALPATERADFVCQLQTNVLATDVTTTLPAVKEFVERGDQPSAEQVFSLILKAADISNATRAPFVYRKWSDGVMAEFYAQGDAERELGLPISMNCDRHTVSVAKAQAGFMTFLVAPLYKALLSYAPLLQPIVDQLDANLKHYVREARLAESEGVQA